MEFKVIAKQMGYYKHVRRREGSVFLMDENDMIKKSKVLDESSLEGRVILKGDSGEVILPKWVNLSKNQPQAQASSKGKKPKQHVEPEEEIEALEEEVI